MSRPRDWAELLRVSALLTVPGDVAAGAAATGRRPGARTAWAAAASLCLYQAGMAVNDWADREEDARERPQRVLPSGRITPGQALGAGVALTAAGLGLAAAAGRSTAACAAVLAGTVWAYDLRLKHTPAGPAAMAAARGLDLLMGAVATTHPTPSPPGSGGGGGSGGVGRAVVPAALLAAHTYAVTAVSRSETRGGAPGTALAALATTAVLGALTAGPTRPAGGVGRVRWVRAALAGAYVATAGRPLLHAALNASPPLTQKAVGGGIKAVIPLQAGLAARSGAVALAGVVAALAPVAGRLARTVSAT